MSALASLIGVECAECRRRGHHCQAQMWSDGEPMCLRCADGEPCYAVTAAKLETPARMRESEDFYDLLHVAHHCEANATIEAPTREIASPSFSWNERDQIREQIKMYGLKKAAAMHSVDPCMIADLQPLEKIQQADFSRAEWKHIQRGLERRKKAQERAQMQREAAALDAEKTPRISIRAIQELVARRFGISRDEIVSASYRHKIVLPRQVAMWLACRAVGYSTTQVAHMFGWKHHTTVCYATQKIDRLYTSDVKMKNILEDLKTVLAEG